MKYHTYDSVLDFLQQGYKAWNPEMGEDSYVCYDPEKEQYFSYSDFDGSFEPWKPTEEDKSNERWNVFYEKEIPVEITVTPDQIKEWQLEAYKKGYQEGYLSVKRLQRQTASA